MPLGRAFTLRSKRAEGSALKSRAAPTSNGGIPPLPTHALSGQSESALAKKLVISAPLQLLSTSNMLSYNAPDLRPSHQASTTLSDAPRTSSDGSTSSASSHRSRETLTDASSVENSPVPGSKEDELVDYCKVPSPTQSTKSLRRISSVPSLSQHMPPVLEVTLPNVPQRSPSHSKRAHQRLARQRSMNQIRQSSSSTASTNLGRGLSLTSRVSREQRESLDFFKGTADPSHPFNKELQELHEVAEELSTTVRDVEMGHDRCRMIEQGLGQFTVDDYLMEIQPLYVSLFEEEVSEPMTWI